MARDVDYSRYYKQYHDDSPEHQRWQIDFNRRILAAHVPDCRGRPALDIGCGMGFAMLYLQEEGFEPVEGIDIDPSQVQSCLRKGLIVHQVQDASCFVRQSQERYGLVLAMDLLEHLAPGDQLALARAVWGALLPGGRFICSVPNANSSVASRQRYNDFTHHASFTEHSLDFLLYNAGFRKIEISCYEFYLPPHRNKIGSGDFARRRHYVSYMVRGYLAGLVLSLVRGWRRLEMIGEFGFETGGRIPLSLNLLGIAIKE
jgi:SAM-dependent methyltransferase